MFEFNPEWAELFKAVFESGGAVSVGILVGVVVGVGLGGFGTYHIVNLMNGKANRWKDDEIKNLKGERDAKNKELGDLQRRHFEVQSDNRYLRRISRDQQREENT